MRRTARRLVTKVRLFEQPARTPVVSSGEANVKAASHLSNFPAIVTDAFTWNLIELCSGAITKTGACARLIEGYTADAKRQRTPNPKESLPNHARLYNIHSTRLLSLPVPLSF